MTVVFSILETVMKFGQTFFALTVGLGLFHWAQQYLHVGDSDLIFWVSVVVGVFFGLVNVVSNSVPVGDKN